MRPRVTALAFVAVVLLAGTGRAGPALPPGWRAQWNSATGVPLRMWGRFDAPGAVADAARAERAARAFLAQHLNLIAPGARLADLVLVANQRDGDLRTVGFVQTWHGIVVHGGAIGFVFGHDRLFALGSTAWPHVNAIERPSPLVRDSTASSHKREVLAVAHGYAIADVIEAGDWTVFVDAGGKPLAREPRALYAQATLKYNAGKRYASGERADFPASTASIFVNGTATTTAPAGAFGWSGTSAATVVPSLNGTYVSVSNRAGPNATDSLTAQPNQPVVWSLADDELGDAQLSAYVYVNLAKSRARIINPSVTSWLDARLTVYVNEVNPLYSCNASATATDLHFQPAVVGCENTARVADIVFHEFAHSLHYNSTIMGMGVVERHLTEGLADFFAANLNEDSGIGRGLHFDDAPVRDIDPSGFERVNPVDLDESDPYSGGLIISGALWDLRKGLIRELGATLGISRTERIFTGIMQRASNIDTAFNAALIADDDDADLSNGTPNYCAIERAFGNHGLVTDFVPTKVSLPIVEGYDISLTVDTPVATTCAPLTVTAIKVTWRPGDGVASTFDLVADGAIWKGAFPVQPDYTTVLYSVDVIFDDGSVQTFPNNPADPLYQLFFGPVKPILCTALDEDPQWEQTSNAGFEWQWAVPGARNDDPPAAFTGMYVLGTDLTGDGAYRPDLIVSLAPPPVDVSKYERVHLQYYRWLAVEDARYDQATIVANDREIWRNAGTSAGTLDHVDREWRFHDLDLTPFVVDNQVQVRWTLTTDKTKELGGWSLDDVCIVGITKIMACGDGEIDLGEQCDDGNTRNADGCNNACKYEITAGGGDSCNAGGTSSPSIALVLLALVRVRRRRKLVVEPIDQ